MDCSKCRKDRNLPILIQLCGCCEIQVKCSVVKDGDIVTIGGEDREAVVLGRPFGYASA